MTAKDFVSLLGAAAKPKPTPSGWQCRCPAHEDGKASLSVSEGRDGKTVIHCHAGCAPEDVCRAAGVEMNDLFPPKASANGHAQKRIVAMYPYHGPDGKLLFEAVRYSPKAFRQRQPDASKPGEWVWNLKGVETVLFRLPEVLADVKRGFPIAIGEGEKDVLALVQKGFSATCNPMGAGKWRPAYSESLRGADCIVIPDGDKPGRDHAEQVAASLSGTASRVRVVALPDSMNGAPVKDSSDYFCAGATAADLIDLIDAAPDWTPPTTAAEPSHNGATEAPATFEEITAAMHVEMLRALNDKNVTPVDARRRIARIAVATLHKIGRFFFHSELKDFDTCLFFNRFTKRLERIGSDHFLAWLSDWLCQNRTDGIFKFIFAELENTALAGKETTGILPESFWAARPRVIFLSNGDGQAVKITADGVALVDNGSDGVLFAAGRTLQPWKLVEPRDVFETCALFRNAHCKAAHGKELLRLWAYSLPSNPPSKPPLCLPGPVGSGKTQTAKGLAKFLGVPFVAQKVDEAKEDDFWPSMDAGGLFTLDNADTKCRWLADSLANAATDGCSQRRKKYTDTETVTLRPRAWLCVTTANPSFASDAGLADRLIVVRFDRQEGEETSDAALTDEILANRDAGLSHLAATLRRALADTEPTPSGLNKRHPDFAAFAVRLGRALGREPQTIAALRQAEQDKASFCLENDTIGAALVAHIQDAHSFTGTAAELVPKLVEVDSELAEKLSAKRLGKRLAAIWPHVAETFDAKREEARGGWKFHIAKRSNAPLHL